MIEGDVEVLKRVVLCKLCILIWFLLVSNILSFYSYQSDRNGYGAEVVPAISLIMGRDLTTR